MDASVVLILTWVFAALVVAGYVWFVVWRYRVDRRKKAAATQESDALSRALDKLTASTPAPSTTTRIPSAAEAPPSPESQPEIESEPQRNGSAEPRTADAAPTADGVTTIAGALAGVQLPNDLAPLTTMAARLNAGDRVAFWTDTASVELVGPAFADELERLGYAVIPLDERTLSVQRDSVRLLVVVHPDGQSAVIGDQPAFSTVPDHSVVIEVWLPE